MYNSCYTAYHLLQSFRICKILLKFPLPSEMTIRRRLRLFSVPPGFLDTGISVNILKAQAGIFSCFEKDVILNFDEMKVKSDLYFDQHQKVIRRHHNNVKVMLIRPLVGNGCNLSFTISIQPFLKRVNETVQIVENSG